jgi:acetate---CoA ligase (ADP-forming)
METVREPERFAQVARRAFELGKPIVALKAGRSEVTARVALTHTGALTGDDRVIDALFRQLGIVRVNSVEELVLTANLFAKVGPLPGRRLGIVAISGGVCDLAADLAEEARLALPIFSEPTRDELRGLLPVIGPANNPLDVTGAAMNNQALMGNLLGVVSRDPQLDAIFCVMEPPTDNSPQSAFLNAIVKGIGQALASAPVPAFMIPLASGNIISTSRAFLSESKLPFISGGIRLLVPALGKLAEWTERYRAAQVQPPASSAAPTPLTFDTPPTGNWSEHQASAFLAEHGVPTIPAQLVNSAEQAVVAAHEIGHPVVLKIASPDILHKSDIGGVALDVQSADEVRAAFTRITQAASAVTPAPRIEGVLVSPMRSGGVELLVGISRDVDWGQVLAVGLGGIWVEILKDTSLRVLPITRDEVYSMLEELQGVKLLKGARGSLAADMPALVETIYTIAEVAQRLQKQLESLEINPLRVHGAQIEALDAVITWRASQPVNEKAEAQA